MRYLNRDYWDQQQRELATKSDGNQKAPTTVSSTDTPTKSAMKKTATTIRTDTEGLYAKNNGSNSLNFNRFEFFLSLRKLSLLRY